MIYALIILIFHLLQSLWLYLILQKLNEKDSWTAFIPIVNLWAFYRASGKPFFNFVLLPAISLIVWIFLTYSAYINFVFPIDFYNLLILAFWIFCINYFIVMWIVVLYSIAERCDKWTATTIGFFLIPYIMFPVVGSTMKQKWFFLFRAVKKLFKK